MFIWIIWNDLLVCFVIKKNYNVWVSDTQLLSYVLNFISHMHFNLALLMAPAVLEFEETTGNNARIYCKSIAIFYFGKEITDSK